MKLCAVSKFVFYLQIEVKMCAFMPSETDRMLMLVKEKEFV